MAGKGSKDKRAAWEVDFISVELSKEQKDMLRKWDPDGAESSDAVARLVSDGFKLSLWGDKAHDCVGATLTSPKRGDGVRQRCISARGPDFFGALKALAYKHLIVLDADWGSLDNQPDPDGQWG
jgi:hypothetical protein